MKLWFVIYYFGQLGSVGGPLPGNLDQCMAARADQMGRAAAAVERGELPPNSMQFVCVLSSTRPGAELGDPV